MATGLEILTPLMESDGLYEIVNDHVLELEPMGAYEVRLASILLSSLEAFVRASRLGRAVSEMLFDLTASGGQKRRPDVAYVSYQRWPKGRRVPRTEAWDVVPELAVEIISSANSADAVVDKVAEYFQAGVVRVWVVYPSQQLVYVYDRPSSVRILTRVDQLDAEPLLPGYRLPLTELFEDGEQSE
jgi:Uma2 family endonuclease